MHNADYERRIGELVEALAYAAECVGAQTLDLRALGKGRRACLVNIINGMLAAADGTAHYRPSYGAATTDRVRERFPELTQADGCGADDA